MQRWKIPTRLPLVDSRYARYSNGFRPNVANTCPRGTQSASKWPAGGESASKISSAKEAFENPCGKWRACCRRHEMYTSLSGNITLDLFLSFVFFFCIPPPQPRRSSCLRKMNAASTIRNPWRRQCSSVCLSPSIVGNLNYFVAVAMDSSVRRLCPSEYYADANKRFSSCR
jgi:hypothetical protein